ncbi:glycosyltransferase family 4 protein [Patescibacteria group bacterium]|nr:glycosyltransferase family 4 protein [Patescibacteria group bacterium]
MPKPWILVTIDYPPMTGGVARYLSDLAAAAKGDMRVIVPLEHPPTKEAVERRPFFHKGVIRWWPLVRLMRDLGRQTDQNILISHVLPIGTAAWIASFFCRLRYTILFHGLDLQLAKRSAWKRWLMRRIVGRAQTVCANSVFVAEDCRRTFARIEPVLLTPGYVPHLLSQRAEARNSLNIAQNEIILLCVCRLIPRKGLDRVIEVLKELPPTIHFVVIGEGLDRDRLEALAKPLADRIQFLGEVADDVRDTWYAAADLFVFPVRKDGDDLEGYGIVCLEAAAAGLPIIVGQNGGAPETVVPEETGLVVNADDRAALTRAIQRLVQDEALRKAMGERGRARVMREARWEDRWKTLSELSK